MKLKLMKLAGSVLTLPATFVAARLGAAEENAAGNVVLPFLTDATVSLSPYFEISEGKLEAFKQVWKKAYEPFAHKSEAVHYAFTFDGNKAHCREAYTSASAVLQHIDDVKSALDAVLDEKAAIAKLLRFEVHGPRGEIDKLREPLAPLGDVKFFNVEWGFRADKPAEAEDTGVHLYPYFNVVEPAEFRKVWQDAYSETFDNASAEKTLMYGFAFEEKDGKTSALGREGYADAEGLLLHLKNVETALGAVLGDGIATLERLEVHAPSAEIEKLKGDEMFQMIGAQYFELEWGFRNATKQTNFREE